MFGVCVCSRGGGECLVECLCSRGGGECLVVCLCSRGGVRVWLSVSAVEEG